MASGFVETPHGQVWVVTDAEGVLEVSWGQPETKGVPAGSPSAPAEGSGRPGDGSALPDAAAARRWLVEALTQLTEYFALQRRTFDLPLRLQGTDFQRAVWQALLEIPYGETRSYGEIARAIGRDKAVRAVGQANRANPLAIVVPCHRVVGRNGSLTGYAGSQVHLKAALLQLERGDACGGTTANGA
ncbi:MAG: methylated-DNA--[protein]-cysteine S-methyltransferase [Alicyclobacillus sp.]|nr:methylated-DNA--[protein]-cysteine S-methyltransferase [Alicyclobacillus sp.]